MGDHGRSWPTAVMIGLTNVDNIDWGAVTCEICTNYCSTCFTNLDMNMCTVCTDLHRTRIFDFWLGPRRSTDVQRFLYKMLPQERMDIIF